ncbi:coiled-coil domain-containing protein 121 [Cavia porcellus]|uniref:coiled-coil domain-containing protein 121 n=1 Tax=Cavia porcellus TaxID=10141 RepID=UPI000661BD1D|nr:coiled-coil domain-containing protein 121 [Cavia porcellus]
MGSPARRPGQSRPPSRRALILPRELRGAAGPPAARAPLTAAIKPLKAPLTPRTQKRVDHGVASWREVPATGPCASKHTTPTDLSTCSSVLTLSDLQSFAIEGLSPERLFAETGTRSSPPSACLILLHQCLPPKKLTKREKRLREKITAALRKLSSQIQDAQMKQNWLLEENRQVQKEKLLVEAESKSILDYLTENSKHRARKCEELWKEYFQQCQQLEHSKQELASRYEKETLDLKAQLLQGAKVQFKLEEQLRALRNITAIKERQDRRIQSLQEQIERIPAETHMKDREAHFQFLQQKALLEQEIKRLDLVREQLRERKRRDLADKAQALEYTAQKSHFGFCRGFYRENLQLRKTLKPLLQEAQKLEAIQSQLENQQQQLEQRHWYQEAIMRGRQRLQSRGLRARSHRGSKDHIAHPQTPSQPPKGSPT